MLTIEHRPGIGGFVIRFADGTIYKDEGQFDGWGYPAIQVYSTMADADDAVRMMPPHAFRVTDPDARLCPECGSDDIERVQGGVFECCDCGHDFDSNGSAVEPRS